MKKQKLLVLPALLLAIILVLCGCEIDLTNLVTDVILITSRETLSERTAEVSSVEEAPSSEPAEENSSDTTTSDTTAEPSELPEPVPEPQESEPVSSKFTPPSSKPASSKVPVSSETVSDTVSQPVIVPQPTPTPMYAEIIRLDFWGLLDLLADQEAEKITAIGALMPFMLAKGNYRGTYTDSKRMGAILQLAEELTFDEFIGVWMDTVDWRELEPVQLCADIGGTLYYCRTVYAERVEGVCYLYEHIGGEQYVRYTISYATQTDASSEMSSAAAE